jgi:hypothetical protein
MVKKSFIPLAEIAWICETISCHYSVLQAPAVTKSIVSADQAFVVNFALLAGKLHLLIVSSQLLDRAIDDIAEIMPLVNKEIATKDITVMLYNNIIITLAIESAIGMSAVDKVIQNRINDAYAEFFRAVLIPSVEYPA